jgi:PP-loop superfamily ATP-utilizing enzyme
MRHPSARSTKLMDKVILAYSGGLDSSVAIKRMMRLTAGQTEISEGDEKVADA